MNRRYAVLVGILVVVLSIGLGLYTFKRPQPVPEAAMPVYAYADVEHILMSHPRYSEYHRLELEYNAMVAQYQFEQWNYSHKAAAEGPVSRQFAAVDAAGTEALNQELKARIALKENELNHGLQQQYEKLVQEKKKTQTVISNADNLKIVNLRLKLQNLMLTEEEKKAAEEELNSLLSAAGTDVKVTNQTAAEIDAAMAPYKEEAKKTLTDYTATVKAELEQRQQNSRSAFDQQMATIQDRPDPAIWNQQWKEKLEQQERQMNDVKTAIMADIREKAGDVAQEKGIDMIFGEYAGIGTAIDVTDDIIAKLA